MKKSQKNLLILIIFLMIIMVFSVIFAILNFGNEKILNKIKINNIDIGGLTQEEAIEKMNKWNSEELSKDIEVRYKDFSDTISAQEIELSNNIQEKIKEAYKIGKSGNIIKDNYEILFTNIFGKNLDINIKINENKFQKIAEEIEGKLPNVMVENSYYLEENNLIHKKRENWCCNK